MGTAAVRPIALLDAVSGGYLNRNQGAFPGSRTWPGPSASTLCGWRAAFFPGIAIIMSPPTGIPFRYYAGSVGF
jgi:hypothetical protein